MLGALGMPKATIDEDRYPGPVPDDADGPGVIRAGVAGRVGANGRAAGPGVTPGPA